MGIGIIEKKRQEYTKTAEYDIEIVWWQRKRNDDDFAVCAIRMEEATDSIH